MELHLLQLQAVICPQLGFSGRKTLMALHELHQETWKLECANTVPNQILAKDNRERDEFFEKLERKFGASLSSLRILPDKHL